MLHHPTSLVWASYGLARAHSVRGRFELAIPILERALTLATEHNLVMQQPATASALGYAYAYSGRVSEGLALLTRAVATAESRTALVTPGFIVWLGETCLLANQIADATAHAERAVALGRDSGLRYVEAYGLRLLGEIASGLAATDAQLAETKYREAIALAIELDLRPLLAHCHLGLGKLYRRTGRRQEAQEHLATAMTMHREMGMTYWLEQAEAELKELA
jgi:tetratricopeptide (TPR) repeat protein